MSDQDVQDVIDGVIDIVRKFRAKSIYAFAGH
jgi:hypothetical protein